MAFELFKDLASLIAWPFSADKACTGGWGGGRQASELMDGESGYPVSLKLGGVSPVRRLLQYIFECPMCARHKC